MRRKTIPEEAISSIEIIHYERDRKLSKNLEVAIHFKEDYDGIDVSNDVIMVKAGVFNAEELRQLLNSIESDENE